MKNQNKIETFKDFWPAYLAEHENPASLVCHIGGLALSLVMAAAMLSVGMVFFLVLAALPAVLGAWLGHKLSPRHVEGESERPGWAVRADLKMFSLAVTGRLGREIDRIHRLAASPSSPIWSNG